MEIRYDTGKPCPQAFKTLYDSTGWGTADRDAGYYAAALGGSWAQCAAYDGEVLVGFGRLISDGVLHAFVTEMIVLPAWQGRGLGRVIVDRLVRHCLDRQVTDIQLFCALGKEDFYRKAGFEPRGPGRPGMQYMG